MSSVHPYYPATVEVSVFQKEDGRGSGVVGNILYIRWSYDQGYIPR